MPSNAGRLQGLLKAAARRQPVMFFADMTSATPGAVPAGEHVVLPARPRVLRSGRDATLVSSKTVGRRLTAAQELAELGVDAEVIDLRTLPLDEATLLRSVRKTGRLVVVHEAAAPRRGRRDRRAGVGAGLRGLEVTRAPPHRARMRRRPPWVPSRSRRAAARGHRAHGGGAGAV